MILQQLSSKIWGLLPKNQEVEGVKIENYFYNALKSGKGKETEKR